MPSSISLRRGHTDGIVIQLLADASPINLTGIYKVSMVLKYDGETDIYDSLLVPANLAVTDAITGKVTFTPSQPDGINPVGNLMEGYFWVYETATSRYSVPNGSYFEFNITDE